MGSLTSSKRLILVGTILILVIINPAVLVTGAPSSNDSGARNSNENAEPTVAPTPDPETLSQIDSGSNSKEEAGKFSRFIEPTDPHNYIFHGGNALGLLIPNNTAADILQGIPDVSGSILNRLVNFCYGRVDCGPALWTGTCRTGKAQSPIDLNMKVVKRQKGFPLVIGEEYKSPLNEFFIANNGHTIVVQLKQDGTSDLTITHSDKNSTYVFAQLHFHWGRTKTTGSEHTLNKNRFPNEIHFVHYKKEYENFQAAMDSNDNSAVAVLGVFVKNGKNNIALEPIVSNIKSKASKDTPGVISVEASITLHDFLPKSRSFFRYSGSLTTPSCIEAVLWTVFETPIEFSEQQAAVFRAVVTSHEGLKQQSNFRPTQALNGRVLEYFKN